MAMGLSWGASSQARLMVLGRSSTWLHSQGHLVMLQEWACQKGDCEEGFCTNQGLWLLYVAPKDFPIETKHLKAILNG
eukprot:CAMPEP_0174371028 /NCGR_PEP_ID=MMETSP0811_2-20130205/98253_1 /TAXON_ID=73025 ORGANISM="Eutreptiella gymnastica-like, Strain CCMP1594" /NCGR_SAMPLE_ID=MMETSP0811_2 /ASSEMBLY_ACC=CAM_ASM_000667 /LENGTH=77 /DNA_ID=CAMNT_0015517019 /DNA_START=224 /DNA_END=453 /DNA_ORIENTATION=+